MSDPDSELSPQEQGLALPRTLVAPEPGKPVAVAAPLGVKETATASSAAWDAYYRAHPKVRIDSDGWVYKWLPGESTTEFSQFTYDNLVEEGSSPEEARKLATKTTKGKFSDEPDDEATTLYRAAKLDAEAAKALASQAGSAGAVRSWADTEADKTAEATRKFKDFLSRAKAASDIEQADISTQAARQDFNLNRAKGIESGQFSPFASFYGDVPTQLDGLSSIIRKTIPDAVPSDYGLDHVVGLPAYGRGTLPGGRMPDESGLKNFIGGA